MDSMRTELREALKTLPVGDALDRQSLDTHVKGILEKSTTTLSTEAQKSAWEYLLKTEVLAIAESEGNASPNYYQLLQSRLDLALTFSEQDACDITTPHAIIQDLLETQTISSCSHIFSWIESRVDRLTTDLVPQKGKALILLRTLNELLRRLSKMGSQNTEFCGRILMFLSQVFPLGERSGVNLRGEYGPAWDGPSSTEPNADFYHTFWTLQVPFSRPTLFADPSTFHTFKQNVDKVLPVIKEATAKERAMMGSKSQGTVKRKREDEPTQKSYFFAKFLTSPDLLDLEIADTNFRRQVIFQLMILLQHLMTFTKTAKLLWSNSRNKGIHVEFTLEDADAKWVQETHAKCIEELKQTAPNGRGFAESVAVILEREKNWVRWKNEFCTPIDKEPWSELVDGRKVGLEEATKEKRREIMAEPEEWEHKFGSASLSEIWEMGYKDLSDLQHPFHAGDVKDFAKKVKLEDMRIDMRKKQLAKTGATPATDDSIIAKHEESKQRWNWLALRTARDTHLQHFGKIGSGDVVQLELEIEKERLDAIAAKENKEKGGNKDAGGLSVEGVGNGNGGADVELKASPDPSRDGDGDVKMEASS